MTWHFLARGVSAASVVTRLDGLLADASLIEGAAGVDQIVLAHRYLRWCEQVEQHLQASFADAGLARGVFTPRHWQIRAVSQDTRMVFGMIEGEVREQVRVLGALREQIVHYARLLRPDEDEGLVLVDTNVYAHGQPFEQVRWQSLVKSKVARLVMPLIVVDELDKLKDKGSDSARAVLRTLDTVISDAAFLAPIRIRPGVTLQIANEPPGHIRLERADDEIVRQAFYFSLVTECPVTVITRDRGMRIRALASEVDARMLPPDLERRQQE